MGVRLGDSTLSSSYRTPSTASPRSCASRTGPRPPPRGRSRDRYKTCIAGRVGSEDPHLRGTAAAGDARCAAVGDESHLDQFMPPRAGRPTAKAGRFRQFIVSETLLPGAAVGVQDWRRDRERVMARMCRCSSCPDLHSRFGAACPARKRRAGFCFVGRYIRRPGMGCLSNNKREKSATPGLPGP